MLEDTESWFPAAPNQLHVFTDPSGRGRWRLRNVIERPRGAGRFGGGVATGPGFEALAIDGARIALGAYQDVSGSGGERTGAVYLYEDPNADLDWSDAVRTRLVASDARAITSAARSISPAAP